MKTTIKKELNIFGKTIELLIINNHVFDDCYYIHVNGELKHFQYGNNKLDIIFNEFITEEFDKTYN
ncbi:MAG: hypothetical protein ACOVOQ_12410 [Flavobacterium sp.]|jgi:hypothetical protein